MTTRILIMGLPGSGKTTLAEALRIAIWEEGRTCSWINADEVRRHFNDWDFSREGRIRQSLRMYELSLEANTDYCIVDFVAPLVEMRDNFKPDFVIWVDTIKSSRFPDTDAIFVQPEQPNVRVTEQDAERWAAEIVKLL
jgi:energy-coupling factor transporter ATP-binding protein EcfA2